MIVAALTGSIAMGKSETARMFAARGIPVFDSDAAVHVLYGKGGAAVDVVRRLAPEAVSEDAVDRKKLSAEILRDSSLLPRLESAVHPLVRSMQEQFLSGAKASGAKLALLDIPLLFETGRDKDVDAVIVVSAPAEVQRRRALLRPGMTEEKLGFILSKQTPDEEKRRRADYVIDTSTGLDDARTQVDSVIADLIKRHSR